MDIVRASISSCDMFRETTRLAIAVTARVPTMTTRDSQIGMSGAHGMGSPSLMNGSSFSSSSSAAPYLASFHAV